MIECQRNETSAETDSLSDSFLNAKYVLEQVLTNTDRLLEEPLASAGGFRLWHVMLIVMAGILTASVTVCCFVRLRLPRTKTEIEANAKRRALLKNFRLKLKNLKSAELDDLDYRRALEKLREEFRADNESLAQSEAISILSLCDELPNDDDNDNSEASNGNNGQTEHKQHKHNNGKNSIVRTEEV